MPLISGLIASLLAAYFIQYAGLQDISPPFTKSGIVKTIFAVLFASYIVVLTATIPSPYVYGTWSIRTPARTNGDDLRSFISVSEYDAIWLWEHPKGVPRIINGDSLEQIIAAYANSHINPYGEQERLQTFLAQLQHDRPTSINVEFPSKSLSWSDVAKHLVEFQTGLRWDWQPLRNPTRLEGVESQAQITWVNSVSLFLFNLRFHSHHLVALISEQQHSTRLRIWRFTIVLMGIFDLFFLFVAC